ncbi:hypothetical protein SS50377_23012 [Spironucleus salmonicida]|uniref:Uncharacterized protein n=1 Tax=Spironucleus salmonicida TaxID=348837 RepID=A0A9P8LW60_9EUKA|nr:hypothetical protein SS50377_23012 [Spironucleus salmonicida]
MLNMPQTYITHIYQQKPPYRPQSKRTITYSTNENLHHNKPIYSSGRTESYFDLFEKQQQQKNFEIQNELKIVQPGMEFTSQFSYPQYQKQKRIHSKLCKEHQIEQEIDEICSDFLGMKKQKVITKCLSNFKVNYY